MGMPNYREQRAIWKSVNTNRKKHKDIRRVRPEGVAVPGEFKRIPMWQKSTGTSYHLLPMSAYNTPEQAYEDGCILRHQTLLVPKAGRY